MYGVALTRISVTLRESDIDYLKKHGVSVSAGIRKLVDAQRLEQGEMK